MQEVYCIEIHHVFDLKKNISPPVAEILCSNIQAQHVIKKTGL